MGESLESISPRSITGLSPDAGGAEKRQSGRDGVAIRSVRPDAHNASGFADSLSLSPEARNQLRELQQRDAEVRAHEQAHLAAGGPHVTGGASYTYQKGPDGRQYAIGGQVSIDTSAVPGDPEATEKKGVRCAGQLWLRVSLPGRISRWRPRLQGWKRKPPEKSRPTAWKKDGAPRIFPGGAQGPGLCWDGFRRRGRACRRGVVRADRPARRTDPRR